MSSIWEAVPPSFGQIEAPPLQALCQSLPLDGICNKNWSPLFPIIQIRVFWIKR